MDLENRQFGHLLVLHRGDPYTCGQARWWCRCDLCDKEKLIAQRSLISGSNVSCGCKKQMRLAEKLCPKCGTVCVRITCPPRGFRCPRCINEHRKQKYHADQRSILLNSARHRAKVAQEPFSLVKEDIVVPEVCPVLGIKLEIGDRHRHNNSPSIDKLVPELGYVPENVRVISWRANRIKCDGTLEELERVVAYMRENEL